APGSCKIGDRRIDFHLEVLRQFGAEISKEPTGTYIRAPRRLTGAKLELPYPSVGATEQGLLTAVKADGITELKGAAVEPEIHELLQALQKTGDVITVQTHRTSDPRASPRAATTRCRHHRPDRPHHPPRGRARIGRLQSRGTQ